MCREYLSSKMKERLYMRVKSIVVHYSFIHCTNSLIIENFHSFVVETVTDVSTMKIKDYSIECHVYLKSNLAHISFPIK